MRFVGSRRVDVGSGRVAKGGADVWLIRYDPRPIEVTPRAGDNRGETFTQHNVVREIRRLGAWRGRPKAFRMPAAPEDGLRTLVVVQSPRTGKIVALSQKGKP
jgi:hypothetical protein